MRQFIAKYIGYPLKDFYSKAPIQKTKAFLNKSQFWDGKTMQEYRTKKLVSLVKHAYNNVPYYTDLFNKIGLSPNDISSINDIKKIPVLTKKIAIENQDKLKDKNYKKYTSFKAKTGGTTGPPLEIYKDISSYAFEWGSYFRWYNWIGINLGDPVATFWGAPTVLSTNKKQQLVKKVNGLLTNQLFFNSFELNEQNLNLVISKLNKFKPLLIKGYLSALLQIANYLKNNSIRLDYIPRGIATTSETLFPHQKAFLENIFSCPVYDQYGCTEITSVSFECQKQNGTHINQEHVIVESISNNKSDYSESGKLILTDLDCYIMPFIRYENGDYITLSDKKCSCGINSPLIQKIDGRIAETIILKDGREVHGVFFTDILYELSIESHDILKFQVYQKEKGKIEFRYESKNELNGELADKLMNALSTFFIDVKIVKFERIPPNKSGKHIYIKREINK